MVVKRNVMKNGGGIDVRGHSTNVIVELNEIYNSSVGVHVNTSQATHVYVTNNTAMVVID